MKKKLLLSILGVAAVSSFGQGGIWLDNYTSNVHLVTYAGWNPVVDGTGLGAGWTAGFYYALGDVTGSIASDPDGWSDPSNLGGGLILATGPGSTAAFGFMAPGIFTPGNEFAVTGTSINGGDTITVMVVAYNGATFGSALGRGHSPPFTMVTGSIISPHDVGYYMPAFSVYAIPEPGTLTLAGLSGLRLLLRCRRKIGC
jgi:hypothetical protein